VAGDIEKEYGKITQKKEEEEMKEYRVRVYDDHYLVTDEAVGVGTKVVEKGELEAAVSLTAPEKPRRTYPKGTRKRRTKAATAPADAANV
jgi:hypothetical protein